MKKYLDSAAANGKFRWLMDPDTVDFEDYMWLQRKRELKAKVKVDNK